MAREQGALFWELRVALSLARLRVTQGRQRRGETNSCTGLRSFTEGFGTTDLRAARAMLDALRSVPSPATRVRLRYLTMDVGRS